MISVVFGQCLKEKLQGRKFRWLYPGDGDVRLVGREAEFLEPVTLREEIAEELMDCLAWYGKTRNASVAAELT